MGSFLLIFGAALLTGIPIALTLGIGAAGYLMITGQYGLLQAFPQRMLIGVDQFILLTVPMFILAGNLMNVGGISERIIGFAKMLVGHFRGGMPLVTISSSMFFSGISGSATADAGAIGTIMIPAMRKSGYSQGYAAALVAAASVMGPIIPPSIVMIVYGVLTGTSIGTLFIAGVIPGLVIGGALMGFAVAKAVKEDHPRDGRATTAQIWSAFKSTGPVILLPVLILGGILSGVVTATEASVIAVLYALVVPALTYREFSPRRIWGALVSAASTSSALLFIVAMSSMVTFVFTIEHIPQAVVELATSWTQDKYMMLLLLNIAFLLLGTILEPISALIITAPVIVDLARTYQVDPIHMGIIVIVNLCIGLVTPPVGLCLFVASSVGRVPLSEIIKPVMPMVLCLVGVLLLITYVPPLTLFLPSLMPSE